MLSKEVWWKLFSCFITVGIMQPLWGQLCTPCHLVVCALVDADIGGGAACAATRVLVVGCSSQPWLVPKKDEGAFMSFWSKTLYLPLPDYAARRVSALRLLKWLHSAATPRGQCDLKS